MNAGVPNQLSFANLPNVPIGQPATVINNFPLNNIPVANNLPVVNNIPVINSVPISDNIPYNLLVGNRYSQPVANNFPLLSNVQINSLPVRNNFAVPNNVNVQLAGLPVNYLNIALPSNVPNGCTQVPNTNLPFNTVQVSNNFPENNVNRLPNNINFPVSNVQILPQYNNVPIRNPPLNQPSNLQISNVPFNQPNNVQYAKPFANNVIQNQLPNLIPAQPNLQINTDCGCKPTGLALLVESGLANSPGNVENNSPIVSLNGLQLGGLGGLGNLPLFNGLPVIGVTESVVNLNNPCNCKN